jgi:type IX secretion system PorP/SprF family membrane protein
MNARHRSKRFLVFFVAFFCYQATKAQDFRYNFFQYNAFGVNPALAGMQREASLSFHSRKQKVASGLSHKTLMLSALYPITKQDEHYGTIGISLFQDRQSYFGKAQAFELLAAFHLPLYKPKNISIAFGMQGGSRMIEDQFLGWDYFLAWSAGTMVYQSDAKNAYRKKWFLGASSSNWLQHERYLENYEFTQTPRAIFTGGIEVWSNQKYALIPNVRSIIQNELNFTNYGLSVRRFFLENTGTLFRNGSWGLSGWYAPKQGVSFAVDLDSPTVTLGFSYTIASKQHLFSYKNANEFIVTFKKPIGRKKTDDKPIINDTEPSIP